MQLPGGRLEGVDLDQLHLVGELAAHQVLPGHLQGILGPVGQHHLGVGAVVG